MRRLVLSSALLITAVAAAACEQSRAPTEVGDLGAVFAAKDGGGGGSTVTSECGGRTVLLDSRVALDWGTTLAIRSDRDGADGVYTGNVDGVHAKIFYHDSDCSRSGDMVFDPDMQQKNGPRKLVYVFPAGNPAGVPAGSYTDAPFINFRQLMILGSDINTLGVVDGRDAKIEEKSPGALRGLEYPSPTAVRPDYPMTPNGPSPKIRIGTSVPGCETLEYQSITLERKKGRFYKIDPEVLASDGKSMGQWSHEVADLGEWVVSGQSAQCLRTLKGGKQEYNGAAFDMPFSVVVTEVRG